MNKILQSSMMLLAGAALLASCQKDDRTVNLTAIIADQQAGNAKVYIDGVYGCWQQGDEVRLRSGSNDEATYELTVSTGAASAQITGVTEGAPYTAGYPASCVTAIDDGIVTIEVPAEQSYDTAAAYSGAEATQRIVCPMAAYSADGGSLKFYNASALLAVTVTNTVNEDLTLYAVEVESDNAPLAGTATVGVDADADSITATDNTASKVTLTFSTSVVLHASTGQKTVYIPVLPIAMSQKSNLTVHVKATGSSGKYTFHDESSAAEGVYILQNQIGSVPCTLSSSGVTSVNPYFWGQGSKECPFLIENQTDLENLRTVTNAGTSGYVGNEVYYKQTDTINITSLTSWGAASTGNYAIGNSSKAFTANYDGNNKFIRLKSTISTNYSDCGVFGVVNGNGSIKNLNVKGTITVSASYCHEGGCVGRITGPATITNCTNECNITDSYAGTNSIYGHGGIVGRIGTTNASDKVTVEDCTNLATIEASSNCSGGIVGNIYKGIVTVKKCTNGSSSDASMGKIISLMDYEGGICGYAYSDASGSEISGCKNYGTIKNKATTSAETNYIGGILGCFRGAEKMELTVNSCDNHGSIDYYRTAYSTFKLYAGGIVGAKTQTYGTLNISNCHNEGAITSQTKNNFILEMRAGGICGFISNSSTVNIDGCSNIGEIKHEQSNGTNRFAGGIVGVTEANTILSIKNCYNSGVLTGTYNSAGGMLGHLAKATSATIENSYYLGNLTSNIDLLGGAIGTAVTSLPKVTIKNFYVKFTGTYNPKGVLIANLAGAITDGTFENCFVDASHRAITASYRNNISITDYYAYDDSYNLVSVSDGSGTSYEGQTTLLDALNYPNQSGWKTWTQTSGNPPGF